MRKLLLATALVSTLTVCTPRAYALGQIVFDPDVFADLGQQIQQGVQWLNNQVTEIQNQFQQISWLTDTFDEVSKVYGETQKVFNIGQQLYDSVNHTTSIGGVFGLLDTAGIRNPLPVNPQSVISVMNGSGSMSGMVNSIPSMFNTFSTNNHVYSTGSTYQSMLLTNQENSNAGAQALASQLYQSMSDRITEIQKLQAKIDTSDAKDLAALQARIATEQSYLQAQSVQGQMLQILQSSSEKTVNTQTAELNQKNMDDVLKDALNKQALYLSPTSNYATDLFTPDTQAQANGGVGGL